jgi:SnoaL-like domain
VKSEADLDTTLIERKTHVLTADDRLEIQDRLSLVSYCVDTGDWETLADVFTDDAVADATAVGFGRCEGLREVIESWSASHTRPTSHHSMNVVLREQRDGTVFAQSKGLTVYACDEVHTITHVDVLVRTAAGWRISRRKTVPSAMPISRVVH